MGALNLGQSITLLGALAVGYFIVSTVRAWHRLRHIPGPFLASFSYLWIGYYGWSGTQYDAYKVLGDKYGRLVRVGPNELVTDDPETIRRISNIKSTYPRAGWYDGARFHPDSDAMFSMLDPVRHDKTKAKTAMGYSGRETPGLEQAIDDQVANLISLIRRKYVRKPGSDSTLLPLDLGRVFPLFTLDAISRIALGEEFGCLEQDRDVHGFYHTIDMYLPELIVLADVPWARRFVFSKPVIKLFGPKTTDKAGLGSMMKTTNDVVRQIFAADSTDKTGILASFRRHGLNEQQCQTEGFFMFAAGTETSSSALKMTMYHLISSPPAYQKVKAEMKEAIESGRVSNPIKSAEAKELPYFQAALYEGIRIRAIVTGSFAKVVPPEGDTHLGHFIPGGTSLGMNLSALLSSKTLFGQDADVYRPERFLEVDDKRRIEMQRNVELVFGYGRWMCAGRVVAWHELNKVIFELMRTFEFQMYRPRAATDSRCHGAWVEKDLNVIPTEVDPNSYVVKGEY